MSQHSIEHSLVFNTARRVLKFVAPEFRAVATPLLTENSFVIDLRLKTVEVPESKAFRAAGMILFAAGVLRQRGQAHRRTVFGDVPRDMNDEGAASLCARQHELADQAAYDWSSVAILRYFPEMEHNRALQLTDHRLTYEQWLQYFRDPTVRRY